jgi:FkbM family methyltransferase
MPGEGADSRHGLRHPDPSQLLFQVREVFDDRTYLRHGVEVRPGDVVFDVGANVGVAATFFAAECGASVVHSFEPVGPVFEILADNVEHLEAVRPHRLGLSDREGEVGFTYYPGAAAMSGRYAEADRDRLMVKSVLTGMGVSPEDADRRLEGDFVAQPVTCEMTTFSAFVRSNSIERVDLLKIDVERAEADVLAGIDERDWGRIRQIVAEVHDTDGRLEEFRTRLEGLGFHVTGDREQAMEPTDVHMLYAVKNP